MSRVRQLAHRSRPEGGLVNSGSVKHLGRSLLAFRKEREEQMAGAGCSMAEFSSLDDSGIEYSTRFKAPLRIARVTRTEPCFRGRIWAVERR
jgi:hypothetical protein